MREEDIIKSFQLCCETWPYGGVTNKELNVIINNLKIKKLLIYCHKDTIIKNLMNTKTYIVLVHGHFLVIKKGKIQGQDKYNYHKKDKVYCYWELTSIFYTTCDRIKRFILSIDISKSFRIGIF